MAAMKNKNRTGGHGANTVSGGKTVCAVAMIVLYVIQFFVFPGLFPVYFRTSNEAFAMYYISAAAVILAGSWIGKAGALEWAAGDLIYLFLIFLYSADGAYGLNTGIAGTVHDWKLIGLELFLCGIVLFIMQCIIASAVHAVRKMTDS